jgi:hypothetical protein
MMCLQGIQEVLSAPTSCGYTDRSCGVLTVHTPSVIVTRAVVIVQWQVHLIDAVQPAGKRYSSYAKMNCLQACLHHLLAIRMGIRAMVAPPQKDAVAVPPVAYDWHACIMHASHTTTYPQLETDWIDPLESAGLASLLARGLSASTSCRNDTDSMQQQFFAAAYFCCCRSSCQLTLMVHNSPSLY